MTTLYGTGYAPPIAVSPRGFSLLVLPPDNRRVGQCSYGVNGRLLRGITGELSTLPNGIAVLRQADEGAKGTKVLRIGGQR